MSYSHITDPSRLREKLREVYSVEPTDLRFGPLNTLYKRATRRLKTMPFVAIVPLAFVLAALMYILFGHLIVKLASLLQYGF
jgi:hypothetical protein